MKVKRIKSGAIEQQILIEMIVNKSVLAKISPVWPTREGGLFRNKWANIVATWCVNHYLKYNKPPRKSIAALFHNWAENGSEDETQGRPDSTTIELIETFLSGLSKKNQNKPSTDSKFVIDLANKHFSEVALSRHAEGILADLQRGKMKRASRNAHGFKGIDISSDAIISVFGNTSVLKEALSVDAIAKPLITFQKAGAAAAEMFKGSFVPDSFVGFLGQTGVGKSFWLLRVVKEMILAGHPVLYVVTGDMSKIQVQRRIVSLILGRPFEAGNFKYPTKISNYGEDKCEVKQEVRSYKKEISYKDGISLVKKFIKDDLLGNGDLLRMSVHPGYSINAISIMHKAEEEIRNRFVPKSICIDYPDEFAPMPGFTISDDRMNINASWSYLRSIGQRLNCNVTVVTQSDADSYDAQLLSRKNFTDSRKKLDKVTDMYGINQNNKEEKKFGTYRINCLKKRTGAYNDKVCLYVASCLEVSDPMIVSTM